jgi:hypothetical protein
MSKLHRELKTTETNYNTLYLFCIQECFEQWNGKMKKSLLSIIQLADVEWVLSAMGSGCRKSIQSFSFSSD